MKVIEYKWVNTFIQNQTSPQTQRAYTTDLEQFSVWVKSVGADTSSVHTYIAYRDYLEEKYKRATVIRKLAAIRSLCKWLTVMQVLPFNPSLGVKLPKAPNNATTEALSDVEALKILKCAENHERDYAILSMLLYLGLRRSELSNLRFKDIGTERGITVVRVIGKGEVERFLPLPPLIVDSIARINMGKDLEGRLFDISPDGIYYLVKKYAGLAGISKNISPHSLRATMVSNAIEQGATSMQLQHACGWSGPQQIARYNKRKQEIQNSAIWKVKYE